MKRLVFIIFSVIIVSSFLLISCGGNTTTSTTKTSTSTSTAVTTTTSTSTTATPASTKQYGGTLVITCDESIDALGYPAEAQPKGMLYYKSALPVMETLVTVDNQEKILPGLADSWEIAPDGKTITLHLHKGIKFHDGTDFNATAVKYNLEAWDVKNAPYLANVTSITTPDDYTVVLNLKQYDAFLLLRFAEGAVGMIASPTAMKKPTTPDTMAQDHMVGTGPFTFVDWKRQDYAKYKKNPNYWQAGKPYLDAIEYRFVPDYMTRQLSFKAGETQYTGALYPVDANKLKAEGYRIEPSELTFVWYFVFDGANSDSPFAKPEVRQAVEYAIDKDTMAKGIGEGYMQAAYQFAQPNAAYYSADYKGRVYDKAKAKELLAAAGYPNGFKSTITTDVRVKMDLVTAVQTYLKDVGIDCQVETADVPKMMDHVMSGWKNSILWQGYPTGSTQMGIYNTIGTATQFVSMGRPDGWQTAWSTLVSTTDQNSLLAQFKKLNLDEANTVMAIPLLYDHRLYAAQNSVQDIGWSYGQNAMWWDPANAWLKK
jgi:peptide/nickel transport system substrate-binding protein